MSGMLPVPSGSVRHLALAGTRASFPPLFLVCFLVLSGCGEDSNGSGLTPSTANGPVERGLPTALTEEQLWHVDVAPGLTPDDGATEEDALSGVVLRLAGADESGGYLLVVWRTERTKWTWDRGLRLSEDRDALVVSNMREMFATEAVDGPVRSVAWQADLRIRAGIEIPVRRSPTSHSDDPGGSARGAQWEAARVVPQPLNPADFVEEWVERVPAGDAPMAWALRSNLWATVNGGDLWELRFAWTSGSAYFRMIASMYGDGEQRWGAALRATVASMRWK